jgi:hypothetical protein
MHADSLLRIMMGLCNALLSARSGLARVGCAASGSVPSSPDTAAVTLGAIALGSRPPRARRPLATSYELIICDELGFAPLDDTGAHLLFRFVAAAYERRPLGIGSHRPFEKAHLFVRTCARRQLKLDRFAGSTLLATWARGSW